MAVLDRFKKMLFDPSFQFSRDVSRMLAAHRSGNKLVRNLLHVRIARRWGCHISYEALIGTNVYFPHPTGIVIGAGSIIGDNCSIYQNVTIGRRVSTEPVCPVIERGCTLYCGATVIGDVHLLEGTVVAASAVVTKGTGLPHDVLGGIPAKTLVQGVIR